MGVLRSTKMAMTGFEPTSHTTVGRVGYPLNSTTGAPAGQYAEKIENTRKGRDVSSQIHEIFYFPVKEKTSIDTL